MKCKYCGTLLKIYEPDLVAYCNKCKIFKQLENIVEVVRCKNCKRCSHDIIFSDYWCNGRRVNPDDFCSYGESITD